MGITLTKTLTRGGLVPATISPVTGGPTVSCMFNPSKYTLSVTNNFRVKGMGSNGNYNMESDESSLNPRELTLSELWFDTPDEKGKDVCEVTNDLMIIAQLKDTSWTPPPPPPSQGGGAGGAESSGPELKPPPAKVIFQWGAFKFQGVIKSLSIDYVLFKKDGTPIRAKANLKLTEYKQDASLPNQNPTSGGSPRDRIWRVKEGERIDYIAAQVYGDATRWHVIAEYNDLTNPQALRSGVDLAIPAF